jgi:hypothetical protein
MNDWFIKIQAQLSQLVDLLVLLPNPIEMDILIRAHVSLVKFDTVTAMLQKEKLHSLRYKRDLIQ